MKTAVPSALFTLMVFGAIPVARSATTYVDYTGTAAAYSGTTASDIVDPTKWASGEVPDGDHDYRIYTPNWDVYRYCGVGIDGEFPGRSLYIYGPVSYLVLNGTHSYSFPGGLSLYRGEIWLMGVSSTFTLGGDVTIKNTEASYGYIRGMINEKMTLVFTGSFHGAANALFNVRQEGASGKSYDIGYKAQFKGDMSDYLGLLRVGAETKAWGRAEFGDTTVGGTIKVLATGTVGPCGAGDGLGEFSVANLDLSAGATLRSCVSSATGGTIRVTNSLTLPETGKINVSIATYEPSVDVYRKTPVLIAPSGSGLVRDRFELVLPTKFSALKKAVAADLVVEDDGEHEVMFLVNRKLVTQCKTDANGQSAFLPAYASHWTGHEDGDTLDVEAVYCSPNFNYNLLTPSSGMTIFGGHSLVIGESANDRQARFYVNGQVCVSNLYVYPKSYFCHNSGLAASVDGTLYAIDPTATGSYIYCIGREGATLTINSDIKGVANIRFSTQNNFYGYGSPTFVLGGTNTAYSGQFLITNEKKVEPYHTTVVIADGRSMGGAMAENTYNGVQLQNRSILRVTASTEIAEPTRGWHLLGHNTIQVANGNDEVKLSSPLTMSGELVKDGPGTLALGGCCKFTAEQSDVPIAGTNKLTVAAGRVKPLAKGSFDGLAISFAAGTGLALALPDEADEDVAAFGLVDVKWATPFDLTACGGTLSVRLDGAETVQRDDEFQLAICTVSATAADALRGHIAVAHVPHHRVQVLERTNPDGSITFYADVKTSGLVLLVR